MTTPKFAMTPGVMGSAASIELAKEEYDQLYRAKSGVLLALGIEERFNIIRENYAEYEREVFDIALKGMLQVDGVWSRLVPDIFTVNRRLLNLLATARLYREHVEEELKRWYGPGSRVVEQWLDARATELEKSLPFRFMEALRNHIQHHDLPIQHLSRPMESDHRPGGVRKLRHRAESSVHWSRIAQDGRSFNAALLAELKTFVKRDDLIPLSPFIRGYVGSLGRIQKAVRQAIAPDVARWDKTLIDALQRAKDTFGSDSPVVIGCFPSDEDNTDEPLPKDEDIFSDPIDRRKLLEFLSRHAHEMPGSDDYVSTE